MALDDKGALVLVGGDALQDDLDAVGVGEDALVGLAVLHEDGQQLADVLLVAVHLCLLVLCGLQNGAQDPPQQLHVQ